MNRRCDRWIPVFLVTITVVSLCTIGSRASLSHQGDGKATMDGFDEALVQLAEREKLNVFCDASGPPLAGQRSVNLEGKTGPEALDTFTKAYGYTWWRAGSYQGYAPQRSSEALFVRTKPLVDEIGQLGIEVKRAMSAEPVDRQVLNQADTVLAEGLTTLLSQLPEERQRKGVLVGELPHWDKVISALWHKLRAHMRGDSFMGLSLDALPADTQLRFAITEGQPFLYIETPPPPANLPPAERLRLGQRSQFSVGFNLKWAKGEK